jgi:hypothetical protein
MKIESGRKTHDFRYEVKQPHGRHSGNFRIRIRWPTPEAALVIATEYQLENAGPRIEALSSEIATDIRRCFNLFDVTLTYVEHIDVSNIPKDFQLQELFHIVEFTSNPDSTILTETRRHRVSKEAIEAILSSKI